MAVERTASATWEGDLMGGSGQVSADSGILSDATVKWSSRAEQADENTSPEELLAAAHAVCVSMALAHGLAESGTPPARIESEATASFEPTGEGFRVTTMRLRIRAEVEGLGDDAFQKAAEGAKDNCPISKALEGNVELTLDAALV